MQQPLERIRHNAAQCRDLASVALTSEARDILSELAQQYEQEAIQQELWQTRHPRRRPAFDWPLA